MPARWHHLDVRAANSSDNFRFWVALLGRSDRFGVFVGMIILYSM